MAHYCSQCGRKLEDGEVCNCTSQVQNDIEKKNEETTVQTEIKEENHTENQEENQKETVNPAPLPEHVTNPQPEVQAQPQSAQQAQQQTPAGTQQQASAGIQQQSQAQQQQASAGIQQQSQAQQQVPPQPQMQQQSQAQQQVPPQPQMQQQSQYSHQQFQQQVPPQPKQPNKQAEWLKEKGAKLLEQAKHVVSEIGPVLKTPVSKTQEYTVQDTKTGMEFIIAKAVVAFVIGIFFTIKVNSTLGFRGVSTFNMLIFIILATAGKDLLEVVVFKSFANMFQVNTNRKAMINVVGVSDLFDTFYILVCGILFLIEPKLAMILGLLFLGVSTYVELAGYQKVVEGSEDKKVYAFAVAKICMMIIVLLVAYLLIGGNI